MELPVTGKSDVAKLDGNAAFSRGSRREQTRTRRGITREDPDDGPSRFRATDKSGAAAKSGLPFCAGLRPWKKRC